MILNMFTTSLYKSCLLDLALLDSSMDIVIFIGSDLHHED